MHTMQIISQQLYIWFTTGSCSVGSFTVSRGSNAQGKTFATALQLGNQLTHVIYMGSSMSGQGKALHVLFVRAVVSA